MTAQCGARACPVRRAAWSVGYAREETIMYTYRIVLDAYDSRKSVAGARVVTYAQGWDRDAALDRIGSIHIAPDGTVSDGINPWPGTRNMPAGPFTARTLPEWTVVMMRVVDRAEPGYVHSED